eukprot:COSAG04_NODE_1146_length_8079_cov_7.674687_6_plen_163_part_00
MLALCSSSATDTETEADTDQDSHSDDSHSREEKPAGPLSPGKVVERVLAPSVAQILAAAGAVEVTATVLMQVIPAGDTPREASEGGVDERPPVLQSATLLLSTIAAKHDAHAFFRCEHPRPHEFPLDRIRARERFCAVRPAAVVRSGRSWLRSTTVSKPHHS